MLDLGAVLPAFEGQKPNEAVLKLINPLDVDMEVQMRTCHFPLNHAYLQSSYRLYTGYFCILSACLASP